MNTVLLGVLLSLYGVAPQPDWPEFSMSIFHRRNAHTHKEWDRLMPGDTVHYFKHGQVPYFRMYGVNLLSSSDSTTRLAFTSITLTSYAADTIVQQVFWNGRRPITASREISSMNRYEAGLPEQVDYEVLEITCVRPTTDGGWEPWPSEKIRLVVMLDESMFGEEEE